MRSLNEPRRGSLWGQPGIGRCRESAPRVKEESGATLFGKQALTVKPVTPLSPPPRDTRIRCRPMIRHHPPANSDSCSTGLAASAPRQMLFQLSSAAGVGHGEMRGAFHSVLAHKGGLSM
jgi:hypothetical protein